MADEQKPCAHEPCLCTVPVARNIAATPAATQDRKKLRSPASAIIPPAP